MNQETFDEDDILRNRSAMNESEAIAMPLAGESVESINLIRDGMTVSDAAGEELGKVEYVKMGDPESASLGAETPRETGFLGDVARAFDAADEPDIPEPLRSRLLRTGFIKIDGKGWIDTDRYVSADQIAGVNGDTVSLSVLKDELISDKM